MSIRIFITGGTIDKSKPGLPNVGYEKQKSFLREMLTQSRVNIHVAVENLMNKSSRHITIADRKLIARKCAKAKEHHIMVTHGTVTMSQTAKFLAKNVKGKTIVLTGSIVPFKINGSDALFNLGTALVAVQLLPHGVYVCMNGEIYQYNYRYYTH